MRSVVAAENYSEYTLNRQKFFKTHFRQLLSVYCEFTGDFEILWLFHSPGKSTLRYLIIQRVWQNKDGQYYLDTALFSVLLICAYKKLVNLPLQLSLLYMNEDLLQQQWISA